MRYSGQKMAGEAPTATPPTPQTQVAATDGGQAAGQTGASKSKTKSKSKSKSSTKTTSVSVSTSSTVKAKFKGETSGLNGHVFQTIDESKDAMQYLKTLEALERYANKTYEVDMSSIFEKPPVLPTIPLPETPEDSKPQVYKDLYAHEVKQYGVKKDKLAMSLKAIWAVIWGQCSPNMITKLEDEADVATWKKRGDVVSLLQTIQQVCMKFTTRTNPILTLIKHFVFVYNYRQREKDDIHTYLELFKLMVDSINRVGGNFGQHNLVLKTIMIESKIIKSEATDFDFQQAYERLTAPQRKDVKDKAEAQVLAIMFLLGGRPEKYGNLLVDLQNQYIRGSNQFPTTLTDAYNLMVNYTPSLTNSVSDNSQNTVNKQNVYDLKMSFWQHQVQDKSNKSVSTGIQDASATSKLEDPYKSNKTVKGTGDPYELVPGADGKVHLNVTCFRCNYVGHYAHQCSVCFFQSAEYPNTKECDEDTGAVSDACDSSGDDSSETSSLNAYSFSFLQTMLMSFNQIKDSEFEDRYNGLKDSWILLDTQSNCDIFHNKRLLTNIVKVEGPGMVLKSNGNNMLRTNKMGEVKGYGRVWYNKDSLANILSLANVRKKFRITFETGPLDPCPSIIVHCNDGKVLKFQEHKMGLYVYDAAETVPFSNICDNSSKNSCIYSLLQTVEENESKYKAREVKKARKALELYRLIGRPSQNEFIRILQHNLIPDCKVTAQDARIGFDIYGTDPSFLKGKTKRKKPSIVPEMRLIPIPPDVLNQHKHIVLCVDIFYFGGQRFLHTISKHYNFRTVTMIKSATQENLKKSLVPIFRFYTSRGLDIQHMRADFQFECLREDIYPINLHTTAAGEHVPEVERSIQTIEGDCRALYNSLPYKNLPKQLLKGMVEYVVHIRNLFPTKNSVSPIYGPTTLLTGLPMPPTSYFASQL